MRLYSFRVIIEPEKPKGYHGFVPLLPRLNTCGDTINEIKSNLKEAIICYTQGSIIDGQSIPKEEKALELVQTFSEREFIKGD